MGASTSNDFQQCIAEHDHSRRRFLTNSTTFVGAAGLLALGGCSLGGDDHDHSTHDHEGGELRASTDGDSDPELVGLFSPDRVLTTGDNQRIPFALIANGPRIAEGAEFPVTLSLDGNIVTETLVDARVVTHDHDAAENDPNHSHPDLLRYFALRADLTDTGIYDLHADFGDIGTSTMPIQVFDRSEISVVSPGDPLPKLETPTFDSPEGIDPLCTRLPNPCSFHSLTVAEAVAEKKPLALLVATPALCATAFCGPVLETLIESSGDFKEVNFIHLEVYANAAQVGNNYADPDLEIAQAVSDLGLGFEPSLFLTDNKGMVVDRVDNIYDENELRAGLTALSD